MSLRVKCLLCQEILECSSIDTSNLLSHVQEKHPDIKLKKVTNELYTKDISLSEPSLNGHHPGVPPQSRVDTTEQASLQDSNRMPTVRKDDRNHRRTAINDEESMTSVIREIIKANKTANSCNSEMRTDYVQEMFDKTKSDDRKAKTIYKREYKPKDCIKQMQRKKLYKTSIEKWKPGDDKITCPQCGVTKRPIIRSFINKVSRSPFGAALLLTCWPLCFMPCLFTPPKEEYLHCAVCHYCLGTYDHKTGTVSQVS